MRQPSPCVLVCAHARVALLCVCVGGGGLCAQGGHRETEVLCACVWVCVCLRTWLTLGLKPLFSALLVVGVVGSPERVGLALVL